MAAKNKPPDNDCKMDIDWVKCNKCLCALTEVYPQKRLCLTNCGHIFCQECVVPCVQSKCFICSAPKPKTVEIGEALQPDLRLHFLQIAKHPVMNKLLMAMKFRDEQELLTFRLIDHDLKKNEESLKKLKMDFADAKKRLDSIKGQIEQQQNEINFMKERCLKAQKVSTINVLKKKIYQKKVRYCDYHQYLEFLDEKNRQRQAKIASVAQIRQSVRDEQIRKQKYDIGFQGALFKPVTSPVVTKGEVNALKKAGLNISGHSGSGQFSMHSLNKRVIASGGDRKKSTDSVTGQISGLKVTRPRADFPQDPLEEARRFSRVSIGQTSLSSANHVPRDFFKTPGNATAADGFKTPHGFFNLPLETPANVKYMMRNQF